MKSNIFIYAEQTSNSHILSCKKQVSCFFLNG